LEPYIPEAIEPIELNWINAEGIKTVPEWIARLREQLSVTYSALGMKPQSDYNRNIYLDILDYTRQDKELESRYLALEEESDMLNMLLALALGGLVVFVCLMAYLNRRWRVRNTLYVDRLKEALEICREITASVPSDAEELEDVIEAIMASVKQKLMALVGASEMFIRPVGEGEDIPEPSDKVFLLKDSEEKVIGVWVVEVPSGIRKDVRTLLEVIVPYLSWTLENGLAMILLGDERRRIEKEQYVHEQHLVENKRQNLVKKACLFLVTGITPYIDRVVNEVHKLLAFGYLSRKDIKEGKYEYVGELVTRIKEYNDILAIWIKMRQGSLNLHIENFALAPLFEVLQKGRRNFDLKMQAFSVKPTDAWVKADKALTLFMLNTLMENARKYTQQGGEIQVYAREEEDYVEISVQDNGPGLSEEDVACILNEKVYDSGKIGIRTASDVEALQKSKGSGFGLMNCKGIIEKYRKTNELFRVCCFRIESKMGQGSRFYFRLPKGMRRMMSICLLVVSVLLGGCRSGVSSSGVEEREAAWVDTVMNDSLLVEANRLSGLVYQANLDGKYTEALACADSALVCLNLHFMKYAGFVAPQLQLVGEGASAELEWYASRFDTDYFSLLDVRNEAAVAFLALGELDAYRYNNQAYVSLYKQLSVDDSLADYCERMKLSSINKIVAIMICVTLLLALLVGYYLFHWRHWLNYRFGLEQVLEINRKALEVPAVWQEESAEFISELVSVLAKELNELVSLDVLGMGIVAEGTSDLHFAFSAKDEEEEELKEEMVRVYGQKTSEWNAEKKIWCLPLSLKVAGENRCLGVLGLRCAFHRGKEDDRLMLELVVGYVAILVYNAIERVAQKYRDIEIAQDEARRLLREEHQLHVQNMVLDNCLSTIKHETIYYPNRIKQIVDRLQEGVSEEEERRQVETISELIVYYKDVFTILSSCASRQLEEVTFRRGVVEVPALLEAAGRYLKRAARKLSFRLEWKMEAEPVCVVGDSGQLKFLLENLVNEALTYAGDGQLECRAYKEGSFVRFEFIDRRREYSQEELNQLFYPHLSRMQHRGEEVLTGTEYLVCKQIIRDHDEFAGRRGCRINACRAEGGGFMVWFTVPAR
jgi:signal transduction histidine kinase